MIKKTSYKLIFIAVLFVVLLLSIVLCTAVGSVHYSFKEVLKGIFVNDDSSERLIIWNLRFPRVIIGCLVGVGLSLSGCVLQGVMKNHLASPSTIGVTSGASFVGYLVLVVLPAYAYMLPIGSILGAFLTTMLIYALAYKRGVSPTKMILAGVAVSAVYGALNDIIKTFWSDKLGNASGFLVGGLNSVTWSKLYLILPYVLVGVVLCLLCSRKMNILLLGDEQANMLGLNVQLFRFILIAISSLLAGASIAVAGLISFVGLVVPHICRLLIGSDYRFLFPASMLLGAILVILCDLIGRIIMPTGEVPVSIILAVIGAPFFLFLLRSRKEKY